LYKVSSKYFKQFKRSCPYKKCGQKSMKSQIISPLRCRTIIIFLHAHLHIVSFLCIKFHQNTSSGLRGVALTKSVDRRTDGQTDRQGDSYIPSLNFVCGGGGYKKNKAYWLECSPRNQIRLFTFLFFCSTGKCALRFSDTDHTLYSVS